MRILEHRNRISARFWLRSLTSRVLFLSTLLAATPALADLRLSETISLPSLEAVEIPADAAVYTAIANVKDPAAPESGSLRPPTYTLSKAKPAATEHPALNEDGREAPPQKQKVAWKMDGPVTGEIKLGKWRSAENKALGAVATFSLPTVR